TLSKLDSGSGTIVMAAPVVGISYVLSGGNTSVIGGLGGVFNQYTASEFLIPYSGPKFGPCKVLQETYATGAKEPSYPDVLLNAGTLQYTGPGISGSITPFIGPAGAAYSSSVTLQP